MTGGITTVSGKFYAGMTRDVAEEKGLVHKTAYKKYCSLFPFQRQTHITFDELDLNKDGVLQDTEICAERDIEADDKRSKKFGSVALGGAAAIAAPALITNPVTAVIVGVSALALCGYGLFGKDGSKDKQATELYRQENIYKNKAQDSNM